MFSHGERAPASSAFHRRGGPVPLRVIWFDLRDDLLDACNKPEPVKKVPGAGLESRPSSFSHAA
jgi:hypothetical protein